ncbi:hypothetical protein Psi02_33720 [Planotetraspora silvatica]|uniref:PepSY domain-containing protein n=1 Tax=Planotetraspora silvatica TaxID=234614 RepID=A0A8J3UJJ8_9ACTN|nr:PepSY domain-containing protein [Planotetraspora silvatica]GII46948.1 hypothetical protein Psi02_33720 [Planotetraspora silvatica]
MTNTPRISKTVKLALVATGSVALLGLVATSTFAAASPGAPSATENTSTPSPSHGTSTTPTDVAAAPTPTPETATATPATPAGPSPASITSRQAIEIAGKRVPGARVTGVEREWEHGHRVWEVKLVKGGLEYDVQVSAESGTIVRLRQDRGDDGVRAARGLGDDPARHDVGDDHGGHGHGNDDRGPDDHGNDRHGA